MVQISDEELLSSLQECYQKEGVVDGATLNDSSNDYPTQPTYSYRFSGGLEEACKKASVPFGIKKEFETREDVIEAAESFFKQNNELRVDNFNSSDELPSSSRMYRLFDSIGELIEETSITQEIRRQKQKSRAKTRESISSAKKYNENDEKALIEHLWWVLKEKGDCTSKSINNTPGPSSTVYKDVFGSVTEARQKAGVDKFHRTPLKHKLDKILEDTIDEGADGHVYVIKMYKDADKYYYVGSSINVKRRLRNHLNGKNKIKFHHEQELGKVDELDLEPYSVWRVDSYNQDEDETDREFKDRLQSEEHVLSYKIASTFKTNKILGGR